MESSRGLASGLGTPLDKALSSLAILQIEQAIAAIQAIPAYVQTMLVHA